MSRVHSIFFMSASWQRIEAERQTVRSNSGNSNADSANPELIEKAMVIPDFPGSSANPMSVHGIPCCVAGQLENQAAAGNLDG
jgi:hypothetical protein